MHSKKRLSRQDLIRERQSSAFVGRLEQLTIFQHNLTHLCRTADGFAYPNSFLFNTWGQGGVGKTALLRQFEDITRHNQGFVVRVDEAITNVPEAMNEFARQFAKQGKALIKFSERYKVYRQKLGELENDPEAPQFSTFVGKNFARAGLIFGSQVPFVGEVVDFFNEDSIVEGAGEWASYITRKLNNRDEILLVSDPTYVLTPLFLEDLEAITDQQIVLMFDTYEWIGEFLEGWLLEILNERYGVLPSNCIWVISGRNQLNPNLWSVYEPVLFPLEPFTTEETELFMQKKGITNLEVIRVITGISKRLPLLLAILTESLPNNPTEIGETSGTAVERFLKWVDDPQRRQLALDAALPQNLNRDVISHLVSNSDCNNLFNWLITMPFVQERRNGWTYHDVVRTQMMRFQRRESARGWSTKHQSLADFYRSCCQQLELDDKSCYVDTVWRTNMLRCLYHKLCSNPQKELSISLNQFLDILKQKLSFAQQWGTTILQAGIDLDEKSLEDWGKILVMGCRGYENENYPETIAALTALLQAKEIEDTKYSVAYAWRGECFRQTRSYEEALIDFNSAISLDPRYEWAISHRGLTYRLVENYEEAITDFNHSIELNPNYKWAITSRGETYRLMGYYEEAIKDFNQAITLDPNYKWAVACRGETYRLMERYEEAIKDFNQAVSLDCTYKWAISHSGLTYHLMGRYEEAIKDFNQAIALDPNYKWAITSRGETYRSMKRYKEAIKDFNRAIQLDPRSDWIILLRGLTYRLMGCYEEAIADFNRAIELDPNNKWAMESRGEIYRLTAHYEEAIVDFNRAIELDLGFE